MQLWNSDYKWLPHKPYVNEVILRGQNLSLKCYQSLELLMYIEKGFRSFHTGNVGSAGQRASKLLAVKVVALKKKSASYYICVKILTSY